MAPVNRRPLYFVIAAAASLGMSGCALVEPGPNSDEIASRRLPPDMRLPPGVANTATNTGNRPEVLDPRYPGD